VPVVSAAAYDVALTAVAVRFTVARPVRWRGGDERLEDRMSDVCGGYRNKACSPLGVVELPVRGNLRVAAEPTRPVSGMVDGDRVSCGALE
jgi:hypothetical protein